MKILLSIALFFSVTSILICIYNIKLNINLKRLVLLSKELKEIKTDKYKVKDKNNLDNEESLLFNKQDNVPDDTDDEEVEVEKIITRIEGDESGKMFSNKM